MPSYSWNQWVALRCEVCKLIVTLPDCGSLASAGAMKSRRATIILNAAGLLVTLACLAWSSHTLQEIINGFVETRRVWDGHLAQLVRDNWDGITSIPDEKKV